MDLRSRFLIFLSSPFSFYILICGFLMLISRVSRSAFEYEPGKPLYKNLELGVDCESRIAVVGPNVRFECPSTLCSGMPLTSFCRSRWVHLSLQGAGKTTFLKLLEGELIPTEGWVSRHTKARNTCSTRLGFHLGDLNGYPNDVHRSSALLSSLSIT